MINPSLCVEIDGDNGWNVFREVDVLKKSITKGGLSKKKMSALWSQRSDFNWANFRPRCHWAPTKLATRYQSNGVISEPLINANWAWLRLDGDGWNASSKDLVAITSMKGRMKSWETYTPMTDCFFGGSLLMVATGDQRSKDLRGDVIKGWKMRLWMDGLRKRFL